MADFPMCFQFCDDDRPEILEEEEQLEEENDNGEELDLDQVEEEMAAQYGSDEDEYDDPYFNFNIKTIAPSANQIRAQVDIHHRYQ